MPGGGLGARPRPLVRSAALLLTYPLSPFVSQPWLCPGRDPACPSRNLRQPPPPPLVLEKVSPPGGARDISPGLGVPGAAPGRPISEPASVASSRVERLAAPPPKLPPPFRHR